MINQWELIALKFPSRSCEMRRTHDSIEKSEEAPPKDPLKDLLEKPPREPQKDPQEQLDQEKEELILSFDVEASGPAPSVSSMVALGVVAVLNNSIPLNNWVIDSKQWCLKEVLPKDQKCFDEFWSKHMPVWEFILKNAIEPKKAMEELSDWLKELSKTYKLSWVAKPAAYDWMWLQCYYEQFGPEGKFPIGFKAEDINGFRNTIQTIPMEEATRNNFTKFIEPTDIPLTHYPVEDAKRQAYMYLRSKEWCRKNLTAM